MATQNNLLVVCNENIGDFIVSISAIDINCIKFFSFPVQNAQSSFRSDKQATIVSFRNVINKVSGKRGRFFIIMIKSVEPVPIKTKQAIAGSYPKKTVFIL